MTHFAEAIPEERALIPNVKQPSPRNNIKIEEIDQLIDTLIMNKRDK